MVMIARICLLLSMLGWVLISSAQQQPAYPYYQAPFGMPYSVPGYPQQQQQVPQQQYQPQAPQYQPPQYQQPAYQQSPQSPIQQPGASQFRPPQQQQKRSSGMSMGSGQSRRQQQWPQQGVSTPYMQQPQTSAPSYSTPVVEASISEWNPFVQQSLLYRIRVISDGNLKTATPELPGNTAYIIKRLEEPNSYSGTYHGQKKIITDYHYLLMPLQEGELNVPAPSVKGAHATPGGGEGPPFATQARSGLKLRVRPAESGIIPWLPLHDLYLRSYLVEGGKPTAGQPLRLVVETLVTGATGRQMPSLQSQLESEDYQLYRESDVSEGGISRDGELLQGRRVETYTLVPKYGGHLSIPAIKLNWWNVGRDRLEVAAAPAISLHVAGDLRPHGSGIEGRDDHLFDSWWFWLPLLFAPLLVLIYWLWALFGPRDIRYGFSPLQLVKHLLIPLLRVTFGGYYERVQAWMLHLSPRRHLHRFRTWIGRHLPVSWKLWFCLRAVEGEDDPEEWSQALQILAAKHLGVKPHSSLPVLGRDIAACHPRANPKAVEMLMKDLDRAVYGNSPISDFTRWKRDLKRQIKPSLLYLRWRRDRCEVRGGRFHMPLPELNPRN